MGVVRGRGRDRETVGSGSGGGLWVRSVARHAGAVAWSVWLLSASLSVAGLALLYANGSLRPFFDESLGVDAAVALTYPAVGAVICSRRPGNSIGWLFLAVGLLHGTTVFAGEWARYALVTEPGALPGGVVLGWLGTWVWIPGVVLNFSFLLLLFPDGHLPGRGWRPVAWLAAGLAVAGAAYVSMLPWELLETGLPAGNPFEVETALAAGDAARYVFAGLGLPVLLLSVLAPVARFRRAEGVERQQIKWFLYAGVLYALTLVARVEVVENLQVLIAPLLPVAVGVAILRHGLYDIDRIINRTLVYASVTAVMVLVYLGGVVSLQFAFRELAGGESQLAVVASTLAIAALFNPLRRAIQRFIDRRFYRRKYDAAMILAAFAARLRHGTDLGTLRADLMGTVEETVAPAHVSVWLRSGGSNR